MSVYHLAWILPTTALAVVAVVALALVNSRDQAKENTCHNGLLGCLGPDEELRIVPGRRQVALEETLDRLRADEKYVRSIGGEYDINVDADVGVSPVFVFVEGLRALVAGTELEVADLRKRYTDLAERYYRLANLHTDVIRDCDTLRLEARKVHDAAVRAAERVGLRTDVKTAGPYAAGLVDIMSSVVVALRTELADALADAVKAKQEFEQPSTDH